ncbi:MAG: alpha/beta hydrolase [Elusimicrobia bacterium]|nr:alpha/beta hydrolase [Elusimicrobiota bacterium]
MTDQRRLFGAVALSLAILTGGGLALSLYPLTVHDRSVALLLRWSGVGTVRSGSLSGLERNTCRPGAACRCIALLHGLGDSAATWRRLLRDEEGARVPSGRRLVAFELPAPGGYAVTEQASALRAALEPLCPRWTVVGNSLGGWESLSLALQWPQGVERLVLLDPAGLKDASGLSEQTARTIGEPTAGNLRSFNRRVTHKERVLPDRVFEQMAGLLKARHTRDTALAIKDEHFLEGRLKGLTMPVHILWGASDRVIPPSQAEAFKKELPSATLEMIPECGHLPQVECPEPVRRAL